ncbi:MAG TPA: universal stress protein [Acidimicrobiales bacterium]|jgi:nucleotide-binding universal stress UspA family protein|nr:universal stress protein [Acidimicrobiales bacterium]
MAHPSDMDHDSLRQHQPPGAPATTVVVIGIDGSTTSWDAFWWACGEARRTSGRAIAVYVTPVGGSGLAAASARCSPFAIDCAAFDQVASAAADELRNQVYGYAADRDVDLKFVHLRGDTAKEILRVAEADHADLIVVGKSTKARHHLAGSLGRRLIRRRHAPVVVVVP